MPPSSPVVKEDPEEDQRSPKEEPVADKKDDLEMWETGASELLQIYELYINF